MSVAARSKAWIVFSLSDTGIVILIPTWGMDVSVYLFHVCVVLCVGNVLAEPLSKVLYWLCIGLRNWKAMKAQQRAVEP
jgi:hypothetical protein